VIKLQRYKLAGRLFDCLEDEREVAVASQGSDSLYAFEPTVKIGTTFDHPEKSFARIGTHGTQPR
jgi:hypothetical protein